MKVKVELQDRLIVVRCDGMDESLRGKGKFFEFGGVELLSASEPDLFWNWIYFPGTNKDCDGKPAACGFVSNEARDECYRKLTACLEAFKASRQGITSTTPDTYEVEL